MHLFAPMGKAPPILNFFRMMAGTTRLELATSASTALLCNRLILNGVGGHLLIPQGTACHLLSSPYCTQIVFNPQAELPVRLAIPLNVFKCVFQFDAMALQNSVDFHAGLVTQRLKQSCDEENRMAGNKSVTEQSDSVTIHNLSHALVR